MEIKSAKGNFAEGKISTNVLRLALPIMLAECVQILYNLVDRMFIGHIPGYGTQALTGIGIIFPLITIIGAFTNLCSYGGSSICSISRGEKNDRKAEEIMENSFTLLLIYGLAITIIIYLFQKPIFYLMGADDTTIGYALEYSNIYFLGTIFTLIATGMNSFINLQGFGTIGMLTVMIGAFLNIVLDPILIFVLNMGVRGAAIATVISQFVSALWVYLFLTSDRGPLKLRKLSLNSDYVKQIHKLGISGFAFRATNSITQAVVNNTLNIFGGINASLYIASFSIINQLKEVAMLPLTGLTEGSKPVISYNYGAKEYERTEKTIWFMFKLCFLANVIFFLLFRYCTTAMVKIFSSDQDLINICVSAIRIYFSAYVMMTFQSASQHTFVCLNKPKFAVFFAIFRKLILILPFTIILPRIGFGVDGVFYAEVISEIVGSMAAFITMYFSVIKKLRNKTI